VTLIITAERPHVPEWIEREILKVGGKYFDDRPNFRIVWGASKVTTPEDVTSYYDPERWHLEKIVEGRYQHAYKFGYCPHMKPGDKQWCNACFLSGGETFELGSHFRIIERVIQQFVLTERFQKASIDKGARLEREALMERERKREAEAAAIFAESLTANLSAIDRVPHSISPRGSKTLREVAMPMHAGQVRTPDGKRMPAGGDVKQV
jgi:hypothetical protein